MPSYSETHNVNFILLPPPLKLRPYGGIEMNVLLLLLLLFFMPSGV